MIDNEVIKEMLLNIDTPSDLHKAILIGSKSGLNIAYLSCVAMIEELTNDEIWRLCNNAHFLNIVRPLFNIKPLNTDILINRRSKMSISFPGRKFLYDIGFTKQGNSDILSAKLTLDKDLNVSIYNLNDHIPEEKLYLSVDIVVDKNGYISSRKSILILIAMIIGKLTYKEECATSKWLYSQKPLLVQGANTAHLIKKLGAHRYTGGF